MRIRFGIILILLLVPVMGFSQASKIRVAVAHTGNDSIGQAMAFALKEAIRSSQFLFCLNTITRLQQYRFGW